ncbi:MAG TPA: diguanylate cyclase, partial [Usitatibacter sp.]|nr:diguanylate cyclase [Usitatibacter sp.]
MILIVWIFVGIVACLLAAAVYSVGLLAAGRAYVGAEGVWSSAQKEALLHLTRYVIDRQESDYRSYERAIAIPRGDRQARLALDRPQPDFEAARAGFLQGRNHPADLDGMIALFQRFRHFGSGERAMELWAKADSYLEELAAVAREARQAGARAERAQSARLLARIDRVNAALAPLEEEIAATLTGAQRAAQSVLLAGMLLLAGTLLVAAVALSKRLVRHNEALQHTLHENEGQLRRLIEAAPLPLLILRASDQGLLYANERALQQFALDVDSARERAFSDFYVDPAGREALGLALERGSVRDYEVEMKDYAGKRFWLLLSAQRLQYAGEACLLTALANIDDRKRMQDDMRHRAMHDPLTSLPNRAMFMEALDRAVRKARRRSACFSLLFIDLDRFKDVNDSLGHLAGDELLQAVGERLSAAVRQSDLVARLGGDEFVVLIEEHGGPEQVMIVAQKVLALLERPVIIDWREVSISASIGVASFPEDGQDHEALMKNADLAMYQAKERGRNNFQFYSVELNRLSIQRSELEKRLRGALERDEFFLLYQPEIDLKTGRLLGVEALLRWQDPAAGLVFPADFLPLAEETGTIIAIGRWVLEHALRDLKSWRDEGREFTLAVNISARQFQHHGLVNEVFRALQTHG